MFSHFFKTAWRNLMKNKVFSFINIMGLTIGIAVCMMIFLFITNEFSVDKFHKQGKNIYRVMRTVAMDSKQHNVAYLSAPYAPALLNDFKGEVEKAVRVQPANALVSIGVRAFNEKKVINADTDFFDLFTFPLIKGNPASALKYPNSVVLTEATAQKYFGSVTNAMGKTIEVDKKLQLKVTGVCKNVPSNSHLDFDLVVPFSNYANNSENQYWINNNLYTYILLNPNTDIARFNQKLSAFINKYMGKEIREYGYNFGLTALPLSNVYFDKDAFDSAKHGDQTVVFVFLSIAVLILLIACINFMNLSTIRAVERSKEVGMRKVLGALRTDLIRQFIGESILLTAVSCVLATGTLLLVMPFYNQLLGYSLTVSWNTFPIYAFIVGIIIIVGFLAGSYPAFFLSGFSPIQTLKGKLNLGKSGAAFRQTLVIFQFIISVLLIVGTMVIIRQMNYVKNKKTGYNKDQVLLVKIDNGDLYNHRDLFKKTLENEQGIESVSMMSGEPGGFFDTYMFNSEGQKNKWQANSEFVDFQYVKTLGLKIIAGRDFSSQFVTDTTDAVLINRTAATKLGWTPEQAIGKWIQNSVRDSLKRRIVGVVEDFNFLSLKRSMNPLVIAPGDDNRVILIKLKAGNITQTINTIKKDYATAAPVYPFEYSFLDQQFGEMYQTDIRQQRILTVFACLAIFIAALGLFGLASFAATKRIKEIGVRKVLGASVKSIVMLLSKDLLKPVLVATAIALPLGYFVMKKWLQNFAYRTPLHWWIFLFAACITFGIALLTVGYKSYRAARANPVKSLKTD